MREIFGLRGEEQTKAVSVKTSYDIFVDQLEEARKDLREHPEKQDEWGERIKTRLLNLRSSVVEAYEEHALPRYMEVQGPWPDDQKHFLETRSTLGKLLIVPMKSIFNFKRPDFSRGVEAPVSDWLYTDQLAKDMLPKGVRDFVLGERVSTKPYESIFKM